MFRVPTFIGASLIVIIITISLLGPAGLICSRVAPLLVDLPMSGMIKAVFMIVDVVDVLAWIAEERQKINESESINRLSKVYIDLLNTLRSEDNLSEGVYNELTSVCVVCGAEGKNGLEHSWEKGENGICRSWYECRSSGGRIEC